MKKETVESPAVESTSEVSWNTNVEQRLQRIEAVIEKILERVNIKDQPVEIPKKRNYNPDRLPSGPKRMTLQDMKDAGLTGVY